MRTVRFGRNTHFCREMGYVAITRFLVLFWLRFDSDKCDLTQTSGQKNGDWSLWSSVAVRLSSVLSPQSSVLRSSGCNKLYKCGSQKISKQCTFVAERLKTPVLLQKPWFTAFLSRMSQKKHNFEKICWLRTSRKLCNPGVDDNDDGDGSIGDRDDEIVAMVMILLVYILHTLHTPSVLRSRGGGGSQPNLTEPVVGRGSRN